MQKTIQRRLRALERSRSKGQDCRGILLAYYLGGLRPDNPPTNLGAAHARALGFPDEQSLLEESVRILEVVVATGKFGRAWMMRVQQAYQRLFAHWGLEPNASWDARIEALNEMFEALPPELKKWAEAMLEENFQAQLEANEFWTALERGELSGRAHCES
jgi:hypothetical protein